MGTSVYTSLLLKDYKRKAGAIKALRKDLREIAKVVLAKEKELTALGIVIKSREPEWDLNDIQPVATYSKIIDSNKSKVTTLILNCLREAEGQIVASNIITDYVIERASIEITNRTRLTEVRCVIKDRLKSLAKTGKVVRHHDVNSHSFGLWSLPNRCE